MSEEPLFVEIVLDPDDAAYIEGGGRFRVLDDVWAEVNGVEYRTIRRIERVDE